MRRGTTPTITLTVSGLDDEPFDLTHADIYVTFSDTAKSNITFTKRNGDAGVTVLPADSGTIIKIVLTQAETLSFMAGSRVRVQLRAKKDGAAFASDIGTIPVEEILLDGEI